MSNRTTDGKSWPDRIWLQRDEQCVAEGCGPHGDDTTWCRDQIHATDVEYVRADLRSAPEPRDEHWRCFHCGEVCTTVEAATEHFGVSRFCDPICKIDRAEYRRMEENHQRHFNEDSDMHRQIARMETDHQVALRRAEEVGYAKGLKDAGLSGEPAAEPPTSGPTVWLYNRELREYFTMDGYPLTKDTKHEG